MAARRRDLTDEEIIRFQRFSVTESAPNTFTQQAFDTQLSIDRGIIWMIHWIEAVVSLQQLDDPAQGSEEYIAVQVTRESKTTMINIDDADSIFSLTKLWKHAATIGTEAGPMSATEIYPQMRSYPIPIPYSGQNIFVGIITTGSAAQVVNGRIAYTLRRVTDKFFYRVASALIS